MSNQKETPQKEIWGAKITKCNYSTERYYNRTLITKENPVIRDRGKRLYPNWRPVSERVREKQVFSCGCTNERDFLNHAYKETHDWGRGKDSLLRSGTLQTFTLGEVLFYEYSCHKKGIAPFLYATTLPRPHKEVNR